MALPAPLLLPPQRVPLAGALTCADEWYAALRLAVSYMQQAGVDPAVIADILARLEELEQNGNSFLLQGLLSVEVFGTPESGLVSLQLIGDDATPGNTYYYGTGPTGTKGWFAVADALNNGDGIDLSVGPDGVTEISFNADTAEVAHLPGATYKTVQKVIDVMFSPGIITGGEVTELTSTSVRITGGTAVVRIADDNVSELRFFDFPSQDFSVPDVQVTHFYALDYNGGSPVMVESLSSESWDRDTEIPLGSAVRGDGFLSVTPNPYRTGDVITNLIQRLDAIGPVQRDNSVGGLALGETGTRNVTVSAGRLWARVSDFNIAAKNSSVEPMSTVFFNGTNLTVTSGITQWDNQNYNDLGTGALVPLGNNKWANLWFFMSFNGDHYGFAYGTGEHNSLGDAANEGVPSYLTQNFFNQFILLGRFVFQESAATAGSIESAFESVFNVQAVNTHNDLGGLQGGTVGEFYHFTNAEHAFLASVGSAATFDERAQDAVGTILVDSSTIDFTYSDATPSITAAVIPGGIAHANLGSLQDAPDAVAGQHYHLSSAQATAVAAAINAGGGFVTIAGTQTITGAKTFDNDVAISGSGRRIRADFSAATSSDRASLQSSVTNGFTALQTIPNGTATIAGFIAFNNSDVNNSGFFTGLATSSSVMFGTSVTGSGAVLPMRFTITGVPVFEITNTATTVRPGSDNAVNLGDASFRWKEVFSVAGTINTSDSDQKDEIRELTAQELAAAAALAKAVRAFKWKDAIALKGPDGARWHVGWIAQEVRDIMSAHGLDGFAYGFLCYDQWEEYQTPEEVGDDGIVICAEVHRAAGAAYGLRKDELQAFITAAQEQRIEALEALLNI